MSEGEAIKVFIRMKGEEINASDVWKLHDSGTSIAYKSYPF